MFMFGCRLAAGAGRPGEADRRDQDVRSQLAHTGQWEDGLCCSGLAVSACYPTEQRSGQRLCQPNRSLLPPLIMQTETSEAVFYHTVDKEKNLKFCSSLYLKQWFVFCFSVMIFFLFLCYHSSFKRIWKQLSADSLCQDISPQHCQRFTAESRSEWLCVRRSSQDSRVLLGEAERPHLLLARVSLQALESKLAACRNFAKDQRARKTYALDNGNVLNANYSQALHTSYFDKAWVKLKPVCLLQFVWPVSHQSGLINSEDVAVTSVTVRPCDLCSVWWMTGVSDTCVFFPAGQKWSHFLHWFLGNLLHLLPACVGADACSCRF